MKMTVETGLTSISPDPATILLKLQSSSPFQTPQPVSSGGTATQEPVPRDNTTLFMAQEVTVTQEPVTYPVAET